MQGRILIVEDEQIIAADLRNRLQRMGHEVVGLASEGPGAIAMAEELRPDLVLMDVQLEGEMSGSEAGATIEKRTGAQVIFVTAFAGTLVNLPPDAQVVGKPFSRAQLDAAIGSALRAPRQAPASPPEGASSGEM